MRTALCTGVIALLAACGASVRPPLQVSMFVGRGQVESELQRQHYCRDAGPQRRNERFHLCRSPGRQYGVSWIQVEYDRHGRLVRLRRMERYASDERATQRWQRLVQLRVELHGEQSREARTTVSDRGLVPAGTTAWMSWFIDGGVAIVSVYRVRAARDGEPNVVEEFTPAPR